MILLQVLYELHNSKVYMLNTSISAGILKCPVCKELYLHQKEVQVFDRKEDEKDTLQVNVVNKTCSTTISNTGNPSPRRQAVQIKFECENCEEPYYLVLYQHKGNTVVGWNI